MNKDMPHKEALQRQADRADDIADQTVDGDMKEILREAAGDYRDELKHEQRFALFRGETQLTGGFASEQDVIGAARADGLIPEIDATETSTAPALPAGYHIEKLEQPYDPQPEWKLPREIS